MVSLTVKYPFFDNFPYVVKVVYIEYSSTSLALGANTHISFGQKLVKDWGGAALYRQKQPCRFCS